MEANEHVNAADIHRQSESPARTIDSHGSTVGSMETIVDRNEELMQITMDTSTNTTNLDRHSLTNSQISIITKDEKIAQDAQSHIYSSPVYMTTTEKPSPVINEGRQLPQQIELPKLISHAEFEKQQLGRPKSSTDLMTKSPTATIDSKISKKQRFPPELIKIKGDSAKEFGSSKVGRNHNRRNSFPNQVSLGVVQLLLSIALVALGALLVVRGASLATVGGGVWTGGIAAITGALGVINMRKVQTGFLALSLVCIATSTLALAITGVGLTRDISKMEEKINQTKLNNEKIAAAYWLVLTLGLHFIVSVISVYKSASRLCSRTQHDDSMYDTINNSGLPLDHETIEEYIKAMSLSSGTNNLIKKEQLHTPQLMYPTMKAPSSAKANTLSSRSVILIPASLGSALLPPTQQPLTQMMRPPLGLPPPYPMMLPPGATLPPPPPMAYRGGMTLPHNKRPGRFYASHRSQMASARQQRHPHHHPHPHPQSEINGRHTKSHRRTCNSDGNGNGNRGRHQRRKSDTDADNRKAFTYTGLDRKIADSFLARQEQTNRSHIDYSSSGDGESTRNECHDVAM
ncbi:uncharacterized protein LOC129908714 [Episyrphus balteatus]|uniref:uncharacterized protein LOC129908714 n=1 Tax=Episyrphus balteatus TaxID=286459 RepID=UPI002484E42B|nr:uncharacterized protein LOC129908714 [Episyrphus balteatus]